MNALVTGGSGFIGTWVLRELIRRGLRPVAFDVKPNPARWQSVLGVDANQVSFVEGRLTDFGHLRDVMARFDVTHLIHLAALLTPACQADPLEGCRVNVLGTTALFELSRLGPRRLEGLSYASSYAVYGPEPDDTPMHAAQERYPPTFYGVFKKAADMIADQYARHFGINSVGIRPHVVYGPERDQGLTAGPSLAARAAALGESYTIGYRGCVSFDYVEDVARAFVLAALETPPGSNVVDLPGERSTPEQFIRWIDEAVPGSSARLSVSGPEIAPNIPPIPNVFWRLFPDWKATSLRDGVRRTVDFYRSRSMFEGTR